MGTGTQPIPVHPSFAEHDLAVEGDERRAPLRALMMRDLFDPSDLVARGRRHRQRHPAPASPRRTYPLALFTRRAWTIRCSACATTPAPWSGVFQNFVLFTNYRSTSTSSSRLGTRDGDADQRILASARTAGNVVTPPRTPAAAAGDELARPAAAPQMPAYHLTRDDRGGITMVNIGVGPANAKTITDHSPCCARTPG